MAGIPVNFIREKLSLVNQSQKPRKVPKISTLERGMLVFPVYRLLDNFKSKVNEKF